MLLYKEINGETIGYSLLSNFSASFWPPICNNTAITGVETEIIQTIYSILDSVFKGNKRIITKSSLY